MNIKEIDGVKYVTLAEHNEMLLTAIRLERDACARICDHEMDSALNFSMNVAAGNCADKIRDRGELCPPCNNDCNQGRDCTAR